MKRTNLDGWIRRQEGAQSLGREQIEEIQLRKLNILLKREKERDWASWFTVPCSGHASK